MTDAWSLALKECCDDTDDERSEASSNNYYDRKISNHGPKVSYSQLLDKIEQLESETETRTKELEQRLRETEKNLGVLSAPWRYSTTGAHPSESNGETNNDSMRTKTFQLSQDMYSVISSWEWNTKPFWASLFVIFLQFLILLDLIVDQFGGATAKNALRLPGNVEYTVRIAQAASIPIAVFKEEDLREGIEGLFQGMPYAFRGDIQFQSMEPMKWRFGYFLRFGQGFLSMFASFILLFQAETVFEVLVNFLGIEFISQLDNLAFRLGGLGYFGVATRDCVDTIAKAEFRKDKGPEFTGNVLVACSPSWRRTYAHIFGVFFIFLAMASIFISFAFQQYNGQFLPSIVQVEFGDETIPYLGIFSGCYMARRETPIIGRFIFEQMGRSTLQGKLGYCGDLDDGSWVLFYGEDDDRCENFIVKSGSTKTFDVQESAESQWKTKIGLPLDYLQIYEIDDKSGSCGSLELLEKTRDSCFEIELDLDGRSSTFQKRQISVSNEGKVMDAIRSHPIYVGNDGRVVIFTGRRWVLANLGEIGSWENTTTILDDAGDEAFYRDLMKSNSTWILAISEPVDRVTDQGTPLGLQWYFPLDIGEESNTTADFNFYISDLTRPVGLACASCNSKTNTCLYEGVCNGETGKCECKNGASGKFCRDKPFGDGTCNGYFNTEEFGYDGGDCCASTCGESACDDSRIALPFGIDVLSKESEQSRSLWLDPLLDEYSSTPLGSTPEAFGYDECKDPDHATFTIELTPSHWKILDPASPYLLYLKLAIDADFDWYGSFFCVVDFVVLTCDDKPYMEISTIGVATIDEVEECPTYSQTFQVPYGSRCELTYNNIVPFYEFPIPLVAKLFHASDGVPLYEEISAISGIKRIDWETPPSKCITETFSNATKSSIFDKTTIENAAVNKLSSSKRAIDWCESENEDYREMLSERFALEALLTMLDMAETFEGESHHCRVPLVGEGFTLGCNDDDRVTTLNIVSDCANGTLTEILEFLPSLPQLQSLDISGNILKGQIPVDEIANLRSLTGLTLSGGALNGTIPTGIGTLQNLKRIILANNSLTGDIPSELFGLGRLRTIQLDGNGLTGPAFPRKMLSLRDLATYTVSNNRLTGTIPNDIQNLPLVYLDLYGNNVTGSIPTTIGKLVQLILLGLDRNLMTGTIPTEIGNLRVLKYLNLFDNSLSKTIPSELGSLRSLEYFRLQDNDLTGTAISSEILSLKNLITLNISNNRLTGSIPPEVEKLGILVHLYLDNNLLTGTIPTQFGNLQSLKELALFRNRLIGSIPLELVNLSALELCNILDGNSNMTGGSVGVCS